MMKRLLLTLSLLWAGSEIPDGYRALAASSSAKDQALARKILEDSNLTEVLSRAKKLLTGGLNAGSGYGEVWIRDLNTFIELGLQVNDPAPIREALLTFFKFQGPDGDIVDGYIPEARAGVGYKYRRSTLVPGLLAHKNTVETDQESSLIQAVRKYVTVTRDRSILDESIDGLSVRARLALALDYVLHHRFDARHGLVWGATTADWGDVQPEHEWGVELDEHSHRAIDIYDNAMFLIAIHDYLALDEGRSPGQTQWIKLRGAVKRNIHKHLWDARRKKYIPHVYLEGSPFPRDFNEAEVYYHGGTAVAIEAGLLSRREVRQALRQMQENVRRAGAGSIGLTLYPVYPQGTFKNKGMGPYSYQNGGDWCWFGGRMIQQLIRHGFIEEAYAELGPMVERVVTNQGFHEWWSLKNEPRGSGQFRGSAGVLGVAIQQLRAWAESQPRRRTTSCCTCNMNLAGEAASDWSSEHAKMQVRLETQTR